MEHSNWVERWFSQARERADLHVTRIPFQASKEWAFRNGRLVHQSGRFFQVVGVAWEDAQATRHAQPFLHQPEIGTLGFLFCDHELLIQAKVEPGNVGVVQMAPTCQATASNLDRVHGGQIPPFAAWFAANSKAQVYDSFQSEQGSRFFKKFNRNPLAILDAKIACDQNFRWAPVDVILALMHTDCLINTDARSTLVCSPWALLADRKPFTRIASPFAMDLAASFEAPTRAAKRALQVALRAMRSLLPRPAVIRLDKMDGWQVGEASIAPLAGKPFEICQIKVQAATREVPDWDQPILSSFGEGIVELVCGRIDGVLRFLFSLQIEAGLGNAIELGPSLVIEPGEEHPQNTYLAHRNAVLLAQCKQSDEGGRFFQDISTYQLIDLGEVPLELVSNQWLTLAEVHSLLREGGWFTNEARSALSLILYWL